MAIKFEPSPRPSEKRGRWLGRLGAGPTMTPADIERDAAAQLGVPVDILGQPAPAGGGQRRGRLAGWLHDLVHTEPPAARRQRLEAEAAAELGVTVPHQDEQPVVQ